MCFQHIFELSIGIRAGTLDLVSLPKCDPWPRVCFVMDNVLYASMDVCEYNMPCVCENAFISVNPYNCDDMLLESMGVVDKLLKKGAKKFHKNLSKFRCENDDLIAKFNKSNKLVEKYKKLAENSLEKLKEFECLNMDLDAKLVLSNKLVDDLKWENEFLSTSPYQKVERKALKPKPPFRSQPKVLEGSKFVLTCHHCGVIGHIRPQCSKLKREQNHVARSLPKKPSGPKHIVCHHCGAFGHIRPQCSKFHAFKRIKRKRKTWASWKLC